MTALDLVLLGGFKARAAGQAIDVPGRKERALLALLAMPPGEPRSRDKLAGLLWSDRADKQAHDSLKQAVLRLRKSFDSVLPLPVLAERESLTLDRAAVAVDVQEFEQLIGEGTPDAVARATTLYRGDLLDGLDVRDPAFEEWLLLERQRLRDLAREGLAILLDRHLANGAHDQAGAVARRLLALDPLREAAHRALMQIYAEQGQTALALKQYQLCRDVLQNELGVRPEAETERLYQSIQEKRAAARRPAGPAPAAKVAVETSPLLDAPTQQHEPEAAAAFAKPSIAVLPFANLSGDPDQEYFSDGITDDIITGLSHFHDLFVIARSSSFLYKSRSAKVQDIGRDLGVRYVVEGSVRKLGDTVRITAQLVDATTANHLWAERYDRDMKDVFAVQDDVTRTVVATIMGRVRDSDRERALHKSPENLAAYDLLLRGRRCVENWGKKSRDGILQARQMFEHAIALEPDYSTAYADLALTYLNEYDSNWTMAPEAAGERGFELARHAVTLDGSDAWVRLALAEAYLHARSDFDMAKVQVDQAIALNPNEYWNFCFKSWLLTLSGDADAGIACADEAIRLNPLVPSGCLYTQSVAAYCARRYEEAIATIAKIAEPPIEIQACLAACYAQLGRAAEARRAMAEFRRTAATTITNDPGEDREAWRQYWVRIFSFKRAVDFEHLLEGLCKAGLPV